MAAAAAVTARPGRAAEVAAGSAEMAEVAVMSVLAAAADTTAIDYIARFLAGVARSARDEVGTGSDPLAEVVPSGTGTDADAGEYLND